MLNDGLDARLLAQPARDRRATEDGQKPAERSLLLAARVQRVKLLARLGVEPEIHAHHLLVLIVFSRRVGAVEELVESTGGRAGCVVRVLRSRDLPPAAQVERLAVELAAALRLLMQGGVSESYGC